MKPHDKGWVPLAQLSPPTPFLLRQSSPQSLLQKPYRLSNDPRRRSQRTSNLELSLLILRSNSFRGKDVSEAPQGEPLLVQSPPAHPRKITTPPEVSNGISSSPQVSLFPHPSLSFSLLFFLNSEMPLFSFYDWSPPFPLLSRPTLVFVWGKVPEVKGFLPFQ